MDTTTLYLDYLLNILTRKDTYPVTYRWAVAEMDAELHANGYLNSEVQ